MSKVILYL